MSILLVTRRLILRPTLFVCVIGLMCGCGASTDSPEVIYEKGNILQARGQFDDAIAAYTEAEKKLSGLPDLFFNRGLCYERLRLADKAIQDYSKCIELEPAHIDAQNNLGVVLASAQRFDEATHQFTALLQLMPDNVLAIRNRGLCYHDLAKFEEAMADYNLGLKLAPEDAETWFQRGNLFLEQSQFENAEADYSQAITLNANHAKAWMNRGVTRYRRGELQNAMSDLAHAKQLDDNIVIPGIDWVQAGTVIEVVAAKPVMEFAPGPWAGCMAFVMDQLSAEKLTNIKPVVEFSDIQCAKLEATQGDDEVNIFVALIDDADASEAILPSAATLNDQENVRQWLVIVAPDDGKESEVSGFRIVKQIKNWTPDADSLTPVVSRLKLE